MTMSRKWSHFSMQSEAIEQTRENVLILANLIGKYDAYHEEHKEPEIELEQNLLKLILWEKTD